MYIHISVEKDISIYLYLSLGARASVTPPNGKCPARGVRCVRACECVCMGRVCRYDGSVPFKSFSFPFCFPAAVAVLCFPYVVT